jgi:leader peptidase (prepilin peptidase)/N-methyltransferase
VLCLLRFGPTPSALGVFLFTCILITITYIDLDYMIIPDVITYPATFIGLAIGLLNYLFSSPLAPILAPPFVYSPFESLFGLAMGPGMLLIVWWLYFKVRKREGLGLGDVKLLAVVGATFGPECAWFTIFCGSIIGSIIGIGLILINRNSVSNTYIPFGPYLAFGAAAYLFELPEFLLYLWGGRGPLSWWIGGIL